MDDWTFGLALAVTGLIGLLLVIALNRGGNDSRPHGQ